MVRSMHLRFSTSRKLALFAVVAAGLCQFVNAPRAIAQIGGGGGGTIGGGPTSGVAVDADGVLRRVTAIDPTGELARQRAAEALTNLDRDVAKRSPLRKVSLTRLERIMHERLADGRGIDDVMKHLAGLTRLEYVFCYPESGDIVVAGPAEAWGEAPSGRILGIESGRPVLELQDLVVALRAFPPGADNKKPFIYCSIDPTDEGLSRMHQFLHELGGRIGNPAQNPGQEQFIVEGLRERLGMQVITVGGISPKTHFAQVMVEADYRMKLIGIGLEIPPVRLTSYVERANPAAVARNALQRWYFVPDYQCVRVSDDSLAMKLEGQGVRLVGENEVVAKDGSRSRASKGNRASDAFVNAFTKVYPKLAVRAPVYAQLRNCIDMAVAAAFIQHQDYYGLVNWKPAVFHDESAYPVETLNAPQQVESAVNSIWKGNTLVTPIGGGVQMRPTEAISSTNLLDDEESKVEEARAAIELSKLAPDQWWWD
ncbi:MAG: DUF1598 domain-containing protein [Planctomycetes bacterium]|nr:DUF1598 domain-containing protein [Planctomycetota bacterium]